MTDFEVEEMASGVEVSGVQTRPRRTHAVAARSRRGSERAARIGDSPWGRRDLVKLVGLHAIGLAVIVIGWIGSSGELDFADQTRWTAVAVFGGMLATIGGASWLLAGLATVSRERRLLREQLGLLYAPERTRSADGSVASTFVSAEGMRRYHRPSCDVVRGKATRPVADPRREDLLRCGMCES